MLFRVFYLLELNDTSIEIKKKIRTNEIKNIFKKFKNNNNYSSEWIKFFNGYFNFLRSLEYRDQDTDKFFKLLNEVSQLMESHSKDDEILFRLLRNEYIFKIIINNPDRQNLKNKFIDECKKSKNKSTLLNLVDQRNRSIKFLCEIISTQNTDIRREKLKISSELKSVDLTWMDAVLRQILQKHSITATQIFLMMEKFKK